jgi:hypothetical protein
MALLAGREAMHIKIQTSGVFHCGRAAGSLQCVCWGGEGRCHVV